MILTSSKERVNLLKAGLTGKQIETIYVVLNGISIKNSNILYDPDKIGSP